MAVLAVEINGPKFTQSIFRPLVRTKNGVSYPKGKRAAGMVCSLEEALVVARSLPGLVTSIVYLLSCCAQLFIHDSATGLGRQSFANPLPRMIGKTTRLIRRSQSELNACPFQVFLARDRVHPHKKERWVGQGMKKRVSLVIGHSNRYK